MTEEPAGGHGPDDATLLNMVRAGDVHAFDLLYQRHESAARRLARDLVVSPVEVSDVVSETFGRVLEATRRGGGPTDAFRPYVLTALRRVCYDRSRSQRGQAPDPRRLPDPGEPFVDPAVAGLQDSLVVKAFRSLPERWSAVLWHTEIEDEDLAQVAPLFGLTDGGVAALKRRAEEGLRQAYLHMYISGSARLECKPIAERLGAYVRDALAVRDTAMVSEHLGRCDACTAVHAELADVSAALRTKVAPIVLGGAAVPYLAASGHGADAITAAADGAGTAIGASAGGEAGAGTAGRRAARGTHSHPDAADDRTGRAAADREMAAAAGLGATASLAAPHRRPRATGRVRWVVAGVVALLAISGGAYAYSLVNQSAPATTGGHHHLAAAGLSPSSTSAPAASPTTKRPASPKPSSHSPSHASPTPRATTPAPSSKPATTAPPPPPPVTLSASVSVSGSIWDGAVVSFQVTDTSKTATGTLTASITLPSGASFSGGGHGRSDGGWTCQATSAGATCQHAAISAGGQSPGSIFISVGGSACGQPVDFAVSSGSAQASAQSSSLQCNGGG